MRKVSEYSAIVESAVESLNLPANHLPGLYEPIIYGMASGGKRLRPVLTLMACEAFGGDVERASDVAVGLEMFHNFTLLHDDVMDNSDMRRGRPTVHKKWDENTAILSGDTMLTLATQLMMHVDDNRLRWVLDTFNQMAIDVYEGQQWDMDFEHRDDVTLDEYMRMITGKTSALIGCAAKIGAIVAGSSKEDAEAMYRYGLSLGLAFQIQDDYLDVYGDAATFGKPIGGDILNDKKTFLMLSALADDSVRQSLKDAMLIADDAEKIAAVRAIYTESGIPQLCRRRIAEYSAEAISEIDSTEMSAEGKVAMKELVASLLGREK